MAKLIDDALKVLNPEGLPLGVAADFVRVVTGGACEADPELRNELPSVCNDRP